MRPDEALCPEEGDRFAFARNVVLSSGAVFLALGVANPALAETRPEPDRSPGPKPLDSEASTEEIFEAMFGRKPEPAARLKYPVIVLGVNLGDIEVLPAKAPGETEIDSDALVAMLGPMLVDERLSELAATVAGRTTLTTAELRSLGYEAEFNQAELSLAVDVPVEFRTIVPIPLQRRRQPIVLADTLQQASTSLIANAFAGTTYIHESMSDVRGFDATQINLDFALNHKGVVFETGLRYSEAARDPLVLSDTRLTYDLVDPMVRLEAGDLTVPTSGLQGNPSIAGIASFRNFNLQPDADFRTNPSQQFELQRPARVSVYINGQFVRELRLPSGRYNLTDLPLRTSAGNDVTLEILYDTGEIERVIFSAFYDFNLLKRGVSEFALNAGPRSEIRSGRREYDTDNIAFSGFYRLGVSDRLTFGGNAQLDANLINVGMESLYATGLGSVGLLANYSDHDEGQGGAVTGLYRLGGKDPKRQLVLDVQARFQDRDFLALGARPNSTRFKYDTAFRLSGNANDKLRLQLSAGFRQRYENNAEEYSMTFTANRRVGRGALGGSIRYDDLDGRGEWSAGISYSIRFGPGALQLGHETRRNATRASFGYQPNDGVNSLGYDIAYTRQSSLDELRAGVGYVGNRIDGRIEQRVAQAMAEGSLGDENFTSLFLGSAFVYADGLAAISRPVIDSYAIFKTRPGADMFDLAVDPTSSVFGSGRSYSAKSSMLGPAVLTDLQSYYPRTVQVEAPDAPAGTSIGTETYSFRPGFRSGYVVEVGTDRNVSVVGVLVDINGQIVPYAAGYAITSDGERRPTFSNAGGRFFVDGLKGGESVRIEFDTPRGMSAEILVPEGALGVARLGESVVLRPARPAFVMETASLRTGMESK